MATVTTDRRARMAVIPAGPHEAPRTPGLEEIFNEHVDYVWTLLRRLGVRQRDLDDVTHEVFIKVHGKLAEYDPERPVRPWLAGFAYRTATGYQRLARHRMNVMTSDVEAVDPLPSAEERMTTREECALVEEAIGTLPLERRAVLVMHDIDEEPIPAIARELGIPVNTAYSRLRLARAELTSALVRLRAGRERSAW